MPARNQRPREAVIPIRVMLVDNSLVARSIFSRVLGDYPGIEIICEAANSDCAVAHLDEVDVDIILLDIEMPKKSGLEALPDILAKAKGARILVVSAFAEENGPAAVQALSLGACDTLAKPGRAGFSGRFTQTLIEKVMRLGRSVTDQSDAVFIPPQGPDFQTSSMPRCISIGSSTGGIPAIHYLLRNLSPAFECPVFITQHLPDAFMPFFARQLGGLTGRTVKVAEVGERVANNHVYLAPGFAHLVCRRERDTVIVDHQAHFTNSRYCPSVDAMMQSLADIYRRDCLGIILSGMGNDGLAGASAFADVAAPVLVQDMQSSVVWGMPGAVAKAGLASSISTPVQMAAMLSRFANSL